MKMVWKVSDSRLVFGNGKCWSEFFSRAFRNINEFRISFVGKGNEYNKASSYPSETGIRRKRILKLSENEFRFFFLGIEK